VKIETVSIVERAAQMGSEVAGLSAVQIPVARDEPQHPEAGLFYVPLAEAKELDVVVRQRLNL